MYAMTITATASTLVLTFTGEIMGHAAALASGIAKAVDGWDGCPVEVDCREVTALGLDGAGLLFGVLRSLRWSPITVRVSPTPAGRGVALLFGRLNESSERLTGAASVPVVFG